MNFQIKKLIVIFITMIGIVQFSVGQCNATLADDSGGNFSTCSSFPNNPNFILTVSNESTTTGTNTSYTINWGDGTPNYTNNNNWNTTSHTYTTLGEFTITFTVTGPNGCTDTETYTVFNGSESITPGFSFSNPTSLNTCVPYSLTFEIEPASTNLPGTIYIFKVNDGSDSIVWVTNPPNQYTHTFDLTSCDTTSMVGTNVFESAFQATLIAISPCNQSSASTNGPFYIEEAPEADFDIEPEEVLCVGDEFNFINTSIGGSYIINGECLHDPFIEWSINPSNTSNYSITAGSLTDTAGFSAIFSQPGTYDISIQAQNKNYSCTPSNETKSICVVPIPAANYSYTQNQSCPSVVATFTNQANTLSSCDATEYSWDVSFAGSDCGTDGEWQFINNTSITSTNPTIKFDSTGVYLVELSVTNICGTDVYLDSVIVGSPPILNIAPIDDLCLSGFIQPELDVTLSCNASLSSPYTWSFPSGSPSSFNGENPPSISYSSPGTYTISVSVNNDCGATTATQTFTIHPLPNVPNISVNEPCEEQNLCFTVQGGNNLEYSWTGPDGWSSTDKAPCINAATPAASGNYFVTITNPNTGCENTTSINATVNPLPNININGNLDICIGTSTTLTASGANTYTWSPSIGLSSTTGVTVTASPSTSTTYTITGTDNNGCQNSTEIEVVVNNLPNVNAGGNQTACQNQNLQLMGTPTGPGGFWSGDHVSNSGIFNSPNLGVTTVTYTYADGALCVDSTSIDICVIHNPISDFSIDENEGCFPLAVSATNASNTIGDCKAATYTWSVNFNGSPCHTGSGNWNFTQGNENSQNAAFSFIESGIYELILEVSNDCDIVTSTQTITVLESPQVEIVEILDACDELTVSPTATINSCLDNNPLTYEWNFPGGSTTSSNLEFPSAVTYDSEGNYTVTLNVTNQCGTTTDTEDFEILTLLEAVVTNDGPLCAGETLTLSTNLPNNLNYSWQGPNGFSSTDPSPTISNTTTAATGSYSVTVSDGITCTRTGQTDVVINPLPNVTITPSSIEICEGESATLTSSGATTYTWSPILFLDTNTGNEVIATPPSTQSYTVTGTDDNGCVNTDEITVTVNPLPIVNAGPDIVLCNQMIAEELTGTPSGGTWSGNLVTSMGSYTPMGLTSDTLVYCYTNNATSCESCDTMVVTVSNPDNTSIQNDTSVCIGSNPLNLIATPSGGTWTSAPSGVTTNGTFNPQTAGTFQITYSTGSGTCLQTENMTLTVNPLPVLNIQGDDEICFGENTTLTVSGAVDYVWSPNNFLNTTTGNEVIATPTSTQTYTVTGTDANSCINTQDITITVNQLPIVDAGDDIQLCNQMIAEELTGTPSGGTWSGNLVTATGSYTPMGVTSDTLIYCYEDNNMCMNCDTMVVNVIDPAQITVPNDTSICIGSSPLNLVATPAGGIWESTPSNVTSNGIFDPQAAGTFNLTYTIGEGTCEQTETMTIIVDPLPNVVIQGNDEICIEESTTLTVSGAIDYVWSPSNFLNTTTENEVIATPTSTQTYTVTGTDANGCVNTDEITIIVNPLPIVSAGDDIQLCNQMIPELLIGTPLGGTWSGNLVTSIGSYTPMGVASDTLVYCYEDANMCVNCDTMVVTVIDPTVLTLPADTTVCVFTDPLNFTTSVIGGIWTSTPTGINSDGTFDPQIDGDFLLTYTVGEGTCEQIGTMNLTVHPLPNVAIQGDDDICFLDSTILTVTGGVDYVWSPSDFLNTTIGNEVISTPPDNQTYIVTGTDANTCVNTDEITITVNPLPIVSAGDDIQLCNQMIPELLMGTPTGGTWSGNLVTSMGSYTPMGVTSDTLVYCYEDGSMCVNCDTMVVTVIDPAVLILPADTAVCVFTDPLNFTTSVPGGIWTSMPTGITTDGTFDPQNDGDFLLTYTVGEGTCEQIGTMNLTVHPLPNIAIQGDDEICFLDSTILTATGAIDYVWSPSDFLNTTIGDEVISTPPDNQTYVVTGTDANTCVNTFEINIIVNPLPIVDAGNDITLCNQPIEEQLVATPLDGTWTGDNVSADGIYLPNGVTSDTLIYCYTDDKMCVNCDTMVVNVEDPEVLTIPQDTAVCIFTDPLTFTTSIPGGEWTSTPNGISLDGFFDPQIDGIFELIYTVGTGTCEQKDTMNLIVHPLPLVDINPSEPEICFGDSIELTASNAIIYNWVPNDSLNIDTGNIIIAFPITTQIYTVTGIDQYGCINSDSVNLVVHPLPIVEVEDEITLCNQAIPEQLIGNPIGGEWTGNIVTSDGIYTPNGVTIDTLAYCYTDNNMCTSCDTLIVNVEDPEVLTIPQDTAVCIFTDPLTFTTSISGGEWTSTPNGISLDGIFDPQVDGNFELIYTVGVGTCEQKDTMNLIVHPLPLVDINPSEPEICFSDSIELTASNAIIYNWTPNDSLNIDTGNVVIAFPITTQIYTVTGIDQYGCVNSDSVNLVVHPLPIVDANENQTYCNNPNPMDIVLLPGTPAGGVWSGQGIADADLGIFRTDLLPNPSLGDYQLTYTYTDIHGCVDFDTVTVSIIEPILADAGSNDTLCYDSGLDTLMGLPAGGTWSGAGIIDADLGIFDPVAAEAVFSTPIYTTYPIVYSFGSESCETLDTIEILVVNMTGYVNAGPDENHCQSIASYNLTGFSPTGGYWMGEGIIDSINGVFDPTILDPGTYTITYFYTEPIAGCMGMDTKEIIVHPLPEASFAELTEQCIDAPIQFNNTSTISSGTIASYLWDFGDGNTSIEINPIHDYAIGNQSYTITLTATSDEGCVNVYTYEIFVAEPPVAIFTKDTDEGCAVLEVNFTNQSTGYQISSNWDFGNATTSGQYNPDPVYYEQGWYDTIYHIELAVSNLCGTEYFYDSVLVHPWPQVAFGFNVDEGCSPLYIEFANTSRGNGETWEWYIGDSSNYFMELISTDSIASDYTFYNDYDDADTTYSVTVISTNMCGADTLTKFVTVFPNDLNAFFFTDPPIGCRPLTVNFENYSGGQNLIHNWDFGDGNFSIATSPVHTFDTAGVFTVILSVDNGCSYDLDSFHVTVYEQPEVVFTHPDVFCQNEPVVFEDLSQGTIGSLWHFGDGDTSILDMPSHMYDSAGFYTIYLTTFAEVTGCPSTDSSVIEILGSPIADFNFDPIDGCIPLEVTFQNSSIDANYYFWDFGNGDFSILENPNYIFTEAGTYNVCLAASDDEGCNSDTTCAQIVVYPLPESNFEVTIQDTCGLPLEVILTNQSTGANGYWWDFGNDSTSFLTNPVANYSDTGIHAITLVSFNQFNCSDTMIQEIRAFEDPFAEFMWTPDNGCQPLDVIFENTSTFANQAYWDFGDGNFSNNYNTQNTYSNTGFYSPSLIVSMDDICFDTVSLDNIIEVFPTPNAAFSFEEIPMTPPDGTVMFYNESSDDGNVFEWDFGDGGFSIEENPRHRYFNNFEHLVTLTVSNDYGCPDSIQRIVTHDLIKGLMVPNAFTPETGPPDVRLFKPDGVGLKSYQMEIFSSWGQLLWSSTKLSDDGRPTEGWNGYFKGKLMPQDVYVWKVEAEFEDGTSWNGMENRRGKIRRVGSVHLLR